MGSLINENNEHLEQRVSLIPSFIFEPNLGQISAFASVCSILSLIGLKEILSSFFFFYVVCKKVHQGYSLKKKYEHVWSERS